MGFGLFPIPPSSSLLKHLTCRSGDTLVEVWRFKPTEVRGISVLQTVMCVCAVFQFDWSNPNLPVCGTNNKHSPGITPHSFNNSPSQPNNRQLQSSGIPSRVTCFSWDHEITNQQFTSCPTRMPFPVCKHSTLHFRCCHPPTLGSLLRLPALLCVETRKTDICSNRPRSSERTHVFELDSHLLCRYLSASHTPFCLTILPSAVFLRTDSSPEREAAASSSRARSRVEPYPRSTSPECSRVSRSPWTAEAWPVSQWWT